MDVLFVTADQQRESTMLARANVISFVPSYAVAYNYVRVIIICNNNCPRDHLVALGFDGRTRQGAIFF